MSANQPIKAGDNCIVITGLGRENSPNIGKKVKVGHRIYGAHGADHSQYGPVHHCDGEGVTQMTDTGSYVVTGWVDFPTAWLEKIDPIITDSKTKKEAMA